MSSSMTSLEKLDSSLLSCVFLTGNIRGGGAVITGEARKLPPVYFSLEMSEGGARAQCRGSKAPSCVFLIGKIRGGGADITAEARKLPPVYFSLKILEEEVQLSLEKFDSSLLCISYWKYQKRRCEGCSKTFTPDTLPGPMKSTLVS